jgi:antitoxin ParD1/3/4
MNVSLTPQFEAFIQVKIESGRCKNAREVVEEGLRLLEERDRVQRLREALAEGEKGDAIPFTPELVAQLKREAARMAREGKQPNPDVCP